MREKQKEGDREHTEVGERDSSLLGREWAVSLSRTMCARLPLCPIDLGEAPFPCTHRAPMGLPLPCRRPTQGGLFALSPTSCLFTSLSLTFLIGKVAMWPGSQGHSE